ncbi:Exocyst complex component SEC5 [Psidium guajava]|nr:Exocyst complex component SEC5 [Psidium guajava]
MLCRGARPGFRDFRLHWLRRHRHRRDGAGSALTDREPLYVMKVVGQGCGGEEAEQEGDGCRYWRRSTARKRQRHELAMLSKENAVDERNR